MSRARPRNYLNLQRSWFPTGHRYGGLVRKGRLELPRVAPLDSKSSASTNSATLAGGDPQAGIIDMPAARIFTGRGAGRTPAPFGSQNRLAGGRRERALDAGRVQSGRA